MRSECRGPTPAGQRVKTAVALDEREARRLGRDQPVAEPELLAELDAVGLLDQQRVGSAVDGVAVDLFAQDDAADARDRSRAARTARAGDCSSYAVARPAMPPPTMTTGLIGSTRRS